jgi:hypothetical protein
MIECELKQLWVKSVLSKFVLLFFVSLLMVSPATAQLKTDSKEPCPDRKTYTGKYRNELYGFSISIPAHLKGYWNSAACAPDGDDCYCFTDHGRVIRLGRDASIDAFVGWYMESTWSAVEYQRSEISYIAQEKNVDHVKLISSGWLRLHKLKARRFTVEFTRNNERFITDQIFALHKDVLYELVLRTSADRYEMDRIPFQKVIRSWRLTPRIWRVARNAHHSSTTCRVVQ